LIQISSFSRVTKKSKLDEEQQSSLTYFSNFALKRVNTALAIAVEGIINNQRDKALPLLPGSLAEPGREIYCLNKSSNTKWEDYFLSLYKYKKRSKSV
jgi:hypothetical protein